MKHRTDLLVILTFALLLSSGFVSVSKAASPVCDPMVDPECGGSGGGCTPTSWFPDPSTVACGQTFWQTSDCGTTQPDTGTYCSSGTCQGGSCFTSTCGTDNNIIDNGEQCDGTNLNGKTCASFGFNSGSLSCFSNTNVNECTFDTSGCYNVFANGCYQQVVSSCDQVTENPIGSGPTGPTAMLILKEGDTVCTLSGSQVSYVTSCTPQPSDCDGSVPPPSCYGYNDQVDCISVSNNYCSCGNGQIDSGEQCDGTNLNGQSCTTIGQGFVGGTLGCFPSNSALPCKFDTSQCVKPGVPHAGITVGRLISTGNPPCVMNQGPDQLTPDGGGWSAGATVLNGCWRVYTEPGIYSQDVRLGVDYGCVGSHITYTPWASQNGGSTNGWSDTSWYTNDQQCVRIAVDTQPLPQGVPSIKINGASLEMPEYNDACYQANTYNGGNIYTFIQKLASNGQYPATTYGSWSDWAAGHIYGESWHSYSYTPDCATVQLMATTSTVPVSTPCPSTAPDGQPSGCTAPTTTCNSGTSCTNLGSSYSCTDASQICVECNNGYQWDAEKSICKKIKGSCDPPDIIGVPSCFAETASPLACLNSPKAQACCSGCGQGYNYDCYLPTVISTGASVGVCGTTYACGVQDGVCPESLYSGFSCNVCDSDCSGVAAACNGQLRNGAACDASCQPNKPTITTGYSPANPTVSNNQVTVMANASSGFSVTSINIYVDGSNVKSCAVANTCSYTANFVYGSHIYYATATDAASQNARDPALGTKNFTVADDVLPTVSVAESPANPGTATTVTLTAQASDADSGLNSIAVKIDGASVKTCASSPCVWSSTAAYGSHAYSATATDNAGNVNTASGNLVVNDAPSVDPANFTGTCNQGQTITILCNASDINQADNTLAVKGWLGTCSNPGCGQPNTVWKSAYTGAAMTAPATADGQPFTMTYTITEAAGTALAATCQATDSYGAVSDPWGDKYPLCVVGCGAVPGFDGIQAVPDPAGNVIDINFTSTMPLISNPVVTVMPGLNAGGTTPYVASYVSNSGNSYTYNFSISPAYMNGLAQIKVTGQAATCPTPGTSYGSVNIDTQPPITSITCNGGLCGHSFYPQDTPINAVLSCSDTAVNGYASGCKQIIYSVDGGQLQTVAASNVSLQASSSTRIAYYSVDNAGNVEGAKTADVSIIASTDAAVAVVVVFTPSTPVNYGDTVQATISGTVNRVSDNMVIDTLTSANTLITDINITTDDSIRLNYLTDSALTPATFTTQKWNAPSKSWKFNIDTSVYHSNVMACAKYLPLGKTKCGTGSYTVNGVPKVSVALDFPDVKNNVVPLTPVGPNFTKTMPITFAATGVIQPSGAACTGDNCIVTYVFDDASWSNAAKASYDYYNKVFTASPPSGSLACDQLHNLKVRMAQISGGASGSANMDFFLSCTPTLTVTPAEKRFVVGDSVKQAFVVTLWNPQGPATYTVAMDTQRAEDSLALNFVNFQPGGSLVSNQPVGSMTSVSFPVMLSSVGAGRAGSFPLVFTASAPGSRYTATASLLIYAESLPEFALWQLAVMGGIAVVVFYKYGVIQMPKTRKRRS